MFNLNVFKRTQQNSNSIRLDWQRDPVLVNAVKQIEAMQIEAEDKTRLGRFVVDKRFKLSGWLAQNWQCGIVAVNVQTHKVAFGIDPQTAFVKKMMNAGSEVSHAIGATAEVKMIDGGKLAVVVNTGLAVTVPTFAQLVNSGTLKPGQFLFGYVNGKPKFGSWQDVLNVAIGGLSQMGKTTTTRFLIAQAAINGARFVVIDPHKNAAGEAGQKALSNGLNLPLLAPIAATPDEWLQAINYVAEIGRMRAAGNADSSPVRLVIDEANSIFEDESVGDEFSKILKKVCREYSKFNVNVICVAHDWRAIGTGGDTGVRDMFQSRYAHRLQKTSAQVLMPYHWREVVNQRPGQIHMGFLSGDVDRAVVPMTTNSDVNSVGQYLKRFGTDSNFSTLQWSDFVRQQTIDDGKPAPAKVKVAAGALPDGVSRADVLRMLSNGFSPSKTVAELWGVSSGRAYQEAYAVVNGIVSELATSALSR